MNEYPNSIGNNMVNTHIDARSRYNIQIEKLPDRGPHKVKPEESHKFGKIIGAALIVGALVGGTAIVGNYQHQSMEQNTQVVTTETLPNGITLYVTENPDFSYFMNQDGQKFSKYDTLVASELAKSYSNDAPSLGR